MLLLLLLLSVVFILPGMLSFRRSMPVAVYQLSLRQARVSSISGVIVVFASLCCCFCCFSLVCCCCCCCCSSQMCGVQFSTNVSFRGCPPHRVGVDVAASLCTRVAAACYATCIACLSVYTVLLRPTRNVTLGFHVPPHPMFQVHRVYALSHLLIILICIDY